MFEQSKQQEKSVISGRTSSKSEASQNTELYMKYLKRETTAPVQMFVDEEQEKQLKSIFQKTAAAEELEKENDPVSEGTKTQMPEDIQSQMEDSFETSFSNVNIHKDSEQATNIGALAYAQGNDIHFAPGQYEPGSQKGQELLGHELTHVVQQREGRVKPDTEQPAFAKATAGNINSDPTLEKEADEMGAKAAQGKMADVRGKGSGVQRKPKTFKIPSGWSLQQIADHLGTTIEALIDANKDKLKNWDGVHGFNADEIITIPKTNTEEEKISHFNKLLSKMSIAYSDFITGNITMPELAEFLSDYTSSKPEVVLVFFNNIKMFHRDNLAYALANCVSDSKLAGFDDIILDRMILELSNPFATLSWEENTRMKKRIISAKKSDPISQIDKDLEYIRNHFNNNITGAVGLNKVNVPADVQLIARGLLAKGYEVPDSALYDGECSEAFIDVIILYQEEVVEMKDGDGVVDFDGGTIKNLFDKKNNSYSSSLNIMYGDNASDLNTDLEGDPLKAWKRIETFNEDTDKYDYSINNNDFINTETYLEHISTLAEKRGVEKDSDNEKALGIASKAATDQQYFESITSGVGFELDLSQETVGSHQVNSVLKNRLMRFHKFISAIGLFRGNMTGSACRDAAYAHKISVAHVMMGNTRPQASKESVRNNLIDVYNGETVAGGTKASNDDILDSDGHIWAKPEHFNKNNDGEAISLKNSSWFNYMETFQEGRDWNILTAEGYVKGDTKRFPLGLNASPGRSKHITGDAIDINSDGFTNKNDAMIDLIALNFGLIRPVPDEQWHFEGTNIQLSDVELNLINQNDRESTTNN